MKTQRMVSNLFLEATEWMFPLPAQLSLLQVSDWYTFKQELDSGSIRSSPRYGLSTPYRLTIRNSARLFHHVLFNMADLHLVLPALNLSTLNAGISIMMQQVRLMMFSLNMVDYSMSFLSLYTWDYFCWTSRGDHSEPFLLFEVYCGTPPSCLKVMCGVAHEILV